MAYSPTLYERETIIRWDDESEEANFYTASPVQMRKMDRLCAEHPESFRVKREFLTDGEISGKDYTIPKNFVSIRTKTRTVTMTDEQRAAMAERMKALNAARNSF